MMLVNTPKKINHMPKCNCNLRTEAFSQKFQGGREYHPFFHLKRGLTVVGGLLTLDNAREPILSI